MSLQAVVRKDFLDVRRAKLVWGVGLLYTLFTVLFFYGIGSGGGDATMYNALFSLAGISVLIVPLIAMVAAYLSVAGERESGSLKFLLSYPNDRRDVVLGKLVARSVVVAASLVFAFAVGLALAVYYFPTVDVPDFVGFVGLTLGYALTYVSIAVGISAATGSRSRAMGAAIGTWFVLNVFWNFFPINPQSIVTFVADRLGTSVSLEIQQLIWSLSPTGAYLNSLELVLPAGQIAREGPATGTPWFLEGWFMLVVLAFWFVVPLGLGLRRFERADLG